MIWARLSDGLAQARREMSARERRDIEQEEIAAAVGVSAAAYSRWEKGQRIPKEDDVQKLAAFFGVTPAYLRYGVVEVAVLDVSHAKPVSAAGKARARVVRDRNEKSQPTVKATRKRKGGAA